MKISQDFLQSPTFKTSAQSAALDSKFARPLCHCLCPSLVRYAHVVTAIIALGFTISPATISGLVVPISVNTVNLKLGTRAWSHISNEVREGLQPTLTYTDAPSAIVRIANRLRVRTSDAHILPNVILGRVGRAERCEATWNASDDGEKRYSVTATARTLPVNQTSEDGVLLASAVTKTSDARFRRKRRGKRSDSKASKSLTDMHRILARHSRQSTANRRVFP